MRYSRESRPTALGACGEGIAILFCAFRARLGVEDGLAGYFRVMRRGEGILRGAWGDAVGGDWAED